ncbi:hypothetical protein ACKI2N_031375 [Cupriavidus sp. 30B13]|uniref:hypothetical protein n=1 Tax=Cupriavidus sp. 30B13 TaxID=3384241 RepID=UPI003B90414D
MTTRTQRLLAAVLLATSALGATLAHAADPRTGPEAGDRYGHNFNIDKPRDVYTDGAHGGTRGHKYDTFTQGLRVEQQPHPFGGLLLTGRDETGVSASPADEQNSHA